MDRRNTVVAVAVAAAAAAAVGAAVVRFAVADGTSVGY